VILLLQCSYAKRLSLNYDGQKLPVDVVKGGENELKIIKKVAALTAVFSFLLVGAVVTAVNAQTPTPGNYTLKPWIYDPDNTHSVVSQVTNNTLHLEKNSTTSTNAAAGGVIKGVEGLSTTDLSLSFTVDGYCGAGAPRFNLYLTNGDLIYLGCIYGNDGTGNVTFMTGVDYGGQMIPAGETIARLDVIQDEQGQTNISNVMVNGTQVRLQSMPNPLMAQCKKDGWKTFGVFKNQGQCVSYFAHGGTIPSPSVTPSTSPSPTESLTPSLSPSP
jgi:hypothetical protein